MRKKSINNLFDNLFWYGLYALPLILLVLYVFKTGSFIALTDLMSSFNLSLFTDNIIFNSLSSIFGSTGVVPLFASPDVLAYLSYMVSVFIVHLCVDFLLFIPRIADYYLNKSYGKGGDC